jgi:hypothetical protein
MALLKVVKEHDVIEMDLSRIGNEQPVKDIRVEVIHVMKSEVVLKISTERMIAVRHVRTKELD